jgi:two-component system cell cycle sensor histidine kinase/response regulator CckA
MCTETPRRRVDLNEAISEVAKVFRSVVGEQVLLRTRLEPALGLSNVDPRKLEAVLVNLLMRARDASPSGGELSVTTSNAGLDLAGAVEISVPPGSYVLIELRVNGSMDVPAEVRDTIRQAHGAVSVAAGQGRETTVRIALPAVARHDPATF